MLATHDLEKLFVVTAEDRQAQLDSEQNETIDGRWRYIEHAATATRVFIRLQRRQFAMRLRRSPCRRSMLLTPRRRAGSFAPVLVGFYLPVAGDNSLRGLLRGL